MKRAAVLTAAISLFAVGVIARADTALQIVTPKNLEEYKFTLTHKVAPKDTVEFVIRRDIRGIDGPGRQAFISHPATKAKGLGTPVKLEEEKDKTLIYRFTVPEDKLPGTEFTLWGQGIRGEGITFRFKLADFWKHEKGRAGRSPQ